MSALQTGFMVVGDCGAWSVCSQTVDTEAHFRCYGSAKRGSVSENCLFPAVVALGGFTGLSTVLL